MPQWGPCLIRAGLGWVFWVNTLQFHAFDTTGDTHTHRHTHLESVKCTHTRHLWLLCSFHCYLLLSQNLMTLFWLLCCWVSIMRLKRVSFCSCPSITIRPRKNQWRLCSLGHRGAKKSLLNKNTTEWNVQSRAACTQHKAILLICSLRTTNPTCWTGPGRNTPRWWGSFESSGTWMCRSPDPRSQRPDLH